jgi:hypothetical protein
LANESSPDPTPGPSIDIAEFFFGERRIPSYISFLFLRYQLELIAVPLTDAPRTMRVYTPAERGEVIDATFKFLKVPLDP